MAKCYACKDKGYANGGYCSCTEGKLRRSLDNSKSMAEAKEREKEKELEQMELFEGKKKIREKDKRKQEQELEYVRVDQGDWVTVQGHSRIRSDIYFIVVQVDHEDRTAFLFAHRDLSGENVKGKKWIDLKYIQVEPISKDEDDLLAMIDVFLDYRNRGVEVDEQLKELADMLP